MTAYQIQQLKINTLALRKIADKVLAQVEEFESSSPAPTAKRKKRSEVAIADAKASILTGFNRKRK